MQQRMEAGGMTHDDAIRTMACERYLLEEMDAEERDRFEEHFFSCTECAEDIRAASRIEHGLRRGGAASAVMTPGRPVTRAAAPAARTVAPARTAADPSPRRAEVVAFRPAWRRPLIVLPWAAAASLAVVLGYQSIVMMPELREAAGPQALTPVTLRGATRGADVEVTLTEGQPHVALSADVIADRSVQEIAYELRGPGGNTLISGRASAPPPGVPLMILVPADRLAAGAGRHVLVLRDAAGAGTVLGEYGFIPAS